MDTEMYKEIIKQQIEKQINDEYTDYKNKKLTDLNTELEMKRNGIHLMESI